MASSTSKKPRLRLKKQVRRTLGGIFLASAVAVAAIPAGSREGGNVQASTTDSNIHTLGTYDAYYKDKYSVTVNDSDTSDLKNIPQIDATTRIYTDESKAFEFAYVMDNNNQYVAVIVGYGTLSLDNGVLTIPNTFDAFSQYNTNSTNGQLAAVGENGNFLFYPKAVLDQDEYDEVVEDTAGDIYTDDQGRVLYTDRPLTNPYSDSITTVNRFYRIEDPVNAGQYIFKNAVTEVTYAGNPADLRELHVSKTVHHDATYKTTYVPCYLDTMDEWKDYTDYELFYDKDHPTGDGPAHSVTNDDPTYGVIYIQCENNQQYHRIKEAKVAYISNQYATRDSNGIWRYTAGNDAKNNPERGIFANNANISTLKIQGTLVGIGDNAFYGCSGLTSLDLSGSNGLQVIGPGVFSDCYQLRTVTFVAADQGTNLKRIGENAFYNCRSIKELSIPTSVTTIGDSCFEGCVKITKLDLCGGSDGSDCALAYIGIDAFKDCQSVSELVFPWNAKGSTPQHPSTYNGLLLSEFYGCISLQKVSVRNEELKFVEEPYSDTTNKTGGYTYASFKKQQGEENPTIGGTFYFEGFNSSNIHELCKTNCFAFHYIDAQHYNPLSPDIYELKVEEDNGEAYNSTTGHYGSDPAKYAYVTYQVNVNNELQFPVNFEGNVESLSFPAHIGPYHIASIADNAFNNKCSLKRITIPGTIVSIGEGAFRGCHNIEYVVFDNDSVQIGRDAFKTQDFSGAHTTGVTACSGLANNKAGTNTDNTPKVKLTFVGNIDANSTPYQYAMSPDGTYNNGSQATSYIEFCSGWPTFITVRYAGEDTDGDDQIDNYFSELVDFPTIACLNYYKDLSYLTPAQVEAATTAIANMNSATVQLTEDQTKFKDAASSLTIPTGINRIKDGLFYIKTQGTAPTETTDPYFGKIGDTSKITQFALVIMDIDEIEASLVMENGEPKKNAAKDAQGIWYSVDPENSDFANCDKLTTLTIFGGADKIDDYAFYGCDKLNSVIINSTDTDQIGDYAFGACPLLANASIASNVSNLGLAPFVGDSALNDVNFNNSAFYTCDSQVIYGLTNGTPTELVEVLPSRTSSIRSDSAITTLTKIDEDALNTSSVSVVDLSKSQIIEVPEHAFHNSKSLTRAILPDKCTTVGKYVFEDSTVNEVSGSNSIYYPPAEFLDKIIIDATTSTDSTITTNNKKVTVYAPEESHLYTYAVRYEYNAEADLTPAEYVVNFYGYDEDAKIVSKLISSQTIQDGMSPSSAMAIYSVTQNYTDSNGNEYTMDGWETTDRIVYTNEEIDAYVVEKDINFYAHYVLADATLHTVTFLDNNGNVAKTYTIKDGSTLAQAQIDVPKLDDIVDSADGKTKYNSGWMPDGSITTSDPITRDVTFRPLYSSYNGPFNIILKYKDPTTNGYVDWDTISNVEVGTDASDKISKLGHQTITGYTFDGWLAGIISPDGADVKNVTSDMLIIGTYTAESSNNGGGDNGGGNSGNEGGGNSGYTDPIEEAIKNGSMFYAYYYYPNGVDLFTKVAIKKGDKAYNIVKPEGYTKGYEWSPNPAETEMDSTRNFILVPSEGTDSTDTYKVSYYYTDGVTLYQQIEIETGSYAPDLMMPAGYHNCVWSPSPTATEITKNTRFTMVAGQGNGNENNGGNEETGNYYTLTVVNGSGSGTYKAGTQAIIVANEPATGLQFGSWTISPDSAPIASKGLSATVVTMPSENVTVTANYVTKTSNTNNSGGNNNGSGNGNGGGNGNGNTNGGTPNGGKVSGGTTVVIDKNGLSNTGVVSAVVNGSSDNFTIKISESSAAAEAVLKALQAEYGDITKIMYFPMDISLYDASGEKKITDTTGLTVTITLPIPDSMIPYAGNNKVAAVVNNQLNVLTPKFTTINGVACVTFTCTHFSPYVIYVNTETIGALGDNSGPSDSTPKTGDGIKPKWFLAVGLAAIGVFFFVWNDKRKKKAVAK